jgi:hypothetical protein
MNKVIKASLVLLLFSSSIMVFSLSCKKESIAQSNTGNSITQNVGILIFKKEGDKANEFWTSKYDGSNQVKVSIATFPIDGDVDGASLKLSPDGKKVFFLMYVPSIRLQSIYTCNIDGSGLTKVVDKVDEFSGAI